MPSGYPWKANTTCRSRVNRSTKRCSSIPCGCSSGVNIAMRSTTFTTRIRSLGPEQPGRGHRLHGGDVPRAGHDDVRVALVVARPLPDGCAPLAVPLRGLEVEVLELRLLVDDDDVD